MPLATHSVHFLRTTTPTAMLQDKACPGWTIHMQTNARILLRHDWLREDRTLQAAWYSVLDPTKLSKPGASLAGCANGFRAPISPRWSFGTGSQKEWSAQEKLQPRDSDPLARLQTPQMSDGVEAAAPGDSPEESNNTEYTPTLARKGASVASLTRRRRHSELEKASTRCTSPERSVSKHQLSCAASPEREHPSCQDAIRTRNASGDEPSAPARDLGCLSLLVVGCKSPSNMSRQEKQALSEARTLWEMHGGRWLDPCDLSQVFQLLETFIETTGTASAATDDETSNACPSAGEESSPISKRRRYEPKPGVREPAAGKASPEPALLIAALHHSVAACLQSKQCCPVDGLAAQQLYAIASIAWQRGWALLIDLQNTKDDKDIRNAGAAALRVWIRSVLSESASRMEQSKSEASLQDGNESLWERIRNHALENTTPSKLGVFSNFAFSFISEKDHVGVSAPAAKRRKHVRQHSSETTERWSAGMQPGDEHWHHDVQLLIRLAGGICVPEQSDAACIRERASISVTRQKRTRTQNPASTESPMHAFKVCRALDLARMEENANFPDSSLPLIDWDRLLSAVCTGTGHALTSSTTASCHVEAPKSPDRQESATPKREQSKRRGTRSPSRQSQRSKRRS
jgi:hypothetical protein